MQLPLKNKNDSTDVIASVLIFPKVVSCQTLRNAASILAQLDWDRNTTNRKVSNQLVTNISTQPDDYDEHRGERLDRTL